MSVLEDSWNPAVVGNYKVLNTNAVGQQLRFTHLFGGYYQIVSSEANDHRPLHGGKKAYIYKLWNERFANRTVDNRW